MLAFAVALWWIAPGTFTAWPAAAAAWSTVVLATGYGVLHGRRFRWSFCRTLCPIGLYYSVVQADSLVGIDFDPAATCTKCGGCNAICPVGLDRAPTPSCRPPGDSP